MYHSGWPFPFLAVETVWVVFCLILLCLIVGLMSTTEGKHSVIDCEHTDGLLSGNYNDYDLQEFQSMYFKFCVWDFDWFLNFIAHSFSCNGALVLSWVVEFDVPNGISPFWRKVSLTILWTIHKELIIQGIFYFLRQILLFMQRINLWAFNPPNHLLEHLLGVFVPFHWVKIHAHICSINARCNSKFLKSNFGISINLISFGFLNRRKMFFQEGFHVYQKDIYLLFFRHLAELVFSPNLF